MLNTFRIINLRVLEVDYFKHYETLIERARDRKLKGYTEKHHILPRSLGGDNRKCNLVKLTPEEHYVAHQLLVKMFPEEKGLVWAACMMVGHSTNDERKGNKLYGWLRRRHSKNAKTRTGKQNGSYGRSWYHDPETLKSGKFLIEDVPEGWVKGRVIYFNKKDDKRTKKRKEKQEIKAQKEKIEKEELYDYYIRYCKGESLNELSKDFNYSYVSLYKKFIKYFPFVKKETGRGNNKL